MRTIVHISVEDILPTIRAILDGQGIPYWKEPDERTGALAYEANALFKENARPVGVLMDISKDEFNAVFNGEGLNDHQSPLGAIYQASDSLTLYAVTVGKTISDEIARLFQASDFALGAMLDSAASEGAEIAARRVEHVYRQHLSHVNRRDAATGSMRFSPGYCGWHISSQQMLFNMLKPGEIGITLTPSYLMHPLKSVSGVIVTGRKEIFGFDDVFDFCRDCADHTCRNRIKSVMEQ